MNDTYTITFGESFKPKRPKFFNIQDGIITEGISDFEYYNAIFPEVFNYKYTMVKFDEEFPLCYTVHPNGTEADWELRELVKLLDMGLI